MLNILGINISRLNKKEVLEKIEQFLKSEKQHYIITPNPEIILEAGKDEEFFYILNHANLSLPDGMGLKIASWVMGENLTRITGADIVTEMTNDKIQMSNSRIAVVNLEGGLSRKEDIEKVLRKSGVKEFFIKDSYRDIEQNLDDLNEFKPDILFCTFGAPYQEKFIYHNLKKLPSVKVAIGVGGSFDFLTNKIKRAPKLMRVIGLEWLWRLIKQPKRWRRIYNAIIVFPIKFIRWRFIRPWQYRPNVVCLLYKRDGSQYKILISERENEAGHWQILQGGTDGEDLMTAGARELREEIDTDKFKGIASFKKLWEYKFDNLLIYRGVRAKDIGGYKGQKQGLFIAEFLGEDKDITINFWDHRSWKWVEADKLIESVHPIRQEATQIFYDKFKSLRITN